MVGRVKLEFVTHEISIKSAYLGNDILSVELDVVQIVHMVFEEAGMVVCGFHFGRCCSQSQQTNESMGMMRALRGSG